ncbi:hypothetical protein Gasu2_36290 [Galdieria sulphuraria]|uniref:Exocyst complex component EXOC2/Sec5 N-terminal domain-containing protein n=1 Tax=Galdieria sulphuraria TaxID=130081 RepID=M2VVA2_GALSU|nr:uncharacterized protein Gasu_52490 [Galdieria sulphuraria]EME27146.1 hypothetical protein Gasu_52490 [Galdieria sulphuraria]GJD09372.1 hypothetical protein Gasu2_36290 [Galdieria sulphuraria]|eukprot:XP_005703666.1 hypothetical protein Gasu_52490 [Galdieria sulphuraria]
MPEVRTPLKQMMNDDLESPLSTASAKTWAEVERVEPDLASLNASFSRNRTLSSPGRMLSSSNLNMKTPRQPWLNLKSVQENDDKMNTLEDPITLGLFDLNTGKFVQSTSTQEKNTKRPFHAEELHSSESTFSFAELDPRSKEFSPQTYLRVVHKETSLDILISGLENVSDSLKVNAEKTSEILKQNLDRIFIWKDAVLARYRKLEDLDSAYSFKLESLSKKTEELVSYIYGNSFKANALYERRKRAFDLIIQHRNFFQLPSRLKQALISGSRSHIMTEYHSINSMLQAQASNAVVDRIKFTVEAQMSEYLEGIYRQITDTGTSKEIVDILINFLLQLQPSKNHLERILELRVENSICKIQKLYNELVQVNKEQKELYEKCQNVQSYQPNHNSLGNTTVSRSFAKRTKIVESLCITYVDCLSELERFTLRLITSKYPVSQLAGFRAVKRTLPGKNEEYSTGSIPTYISDITLSISKRVSDIFSSCLSFLLNFCSDNRFQLSLEEMIELRSCQKNISELKQTFFDLNSACLYMDKIVDQYFDDMLNQVFASLKVIEDTVDENFIHFFVQITTESSPFSVCLKEAISTILKFFDTALEPPPPVFNQLSGHLFQLFKKLSQKIVDKERSALDISEISESVLCYWNHTLMLSLAKHRAQWSTLKLELTLEEEDIISVLKENSRVLLDSCVKKISYEIQKALILLEEEWRQYKDEDLDTCQLETEIFNAWFNFRKNITYLHVIPSSTRMTVLDNVMEHLKELLTGFSTSSDILQRMDRKHLKIFQILLSSVSIVDIFASSIHCSCFDQIHAMKQEIFRASEEQNISFEQKQSWLQMEEFWSVPMILISE